VERDGTSLRELGPGDFLGEIALVDGSPRTATVTAVEPIHAFTIQRDGFLDLIDRISVFRLEVMSALTQRIRATVTDPLGKRYAEAASASFTNVRASSMTRSRCASPRKLSA
jgi:CRP-like cAMP-binding protein